MRLDKSWLKDFNQCRNRFYYCAFLDFIGVENAKIYVDKSAQWPQQNAILCACASDKHKIETCSILVGSCKIALHGKMTWKIGGQLTFL